MSVFNRELVDEWVAIWNSYDLSMVRKLFLNDARVTYFSSEKEGTIKGIDDLIDHHEGFGFVHGGKDQPNKLWLEDTDIVTFDESAIVTAIWCFRRTDSSIQKGPVTLVYMKPGDGYRIAHANFGNY